MFAVTDQVRVPLAVPLAGVQVSQPALLDGVQLQPVPALTVTLPLPPAEVAEALTGAIA